MFVVNADNIKPNAEYQVNDDVDRVKIIAGIVRKYFLDPCVRRKAEEIIREGGCGQNQLCQINAIFEWVKNNIDYLEDGFMVDTYKTPCEILKSRFADCDDYTILLDSLLTSIGFPVGARIISLDRNKPFHHIYALVVYPKSAEIEVDEITNKVRVRRGKVIPLDPSVRGFKVGDELPYAKKRDFLFIFE